MTKIRNILGAFLVVWLISSLFGSVWIGFQDGYNIIPTNEENGESVIKAIENLNFIDGINNIAESVYRITAPSNVFDLLGALGSAGAGVLQTAGGVITFPIEIFGVISGPEGDTGFYPKLVDRGVCK